jgi:hypothetical protein
MLDILLNRREEHGFDNKNIKKIRKKNEQEIYDICG